MFDFTARPLAGTEGDCSRYCKRDSIAYGCAQAFRGLGADVAVTARRPALTDCLKKDTD